MNAILLLPIIFGLFLHLYIKGAFKSYGYKTNTLGIGLLVYVFIFSIFANVFYYHPDFSHSIHAGNGQTNFFASFIFCALYFILLYPFLQGNYSTFSYVKISKELKLFVLILAISSIIEAIMILPNAIYGFRHISFDITGLREEAQSSTENIGSGVTSIPVLIYSYFRTILPIALFHYIAYKINRKQIILLAIATFLTPILRTLSTGTREHMVFPIIETLLAYLLYYRLLSTKTKIITNTSFGIIGGIILITSIWMSLMRFDSANFDSSFWIVKYLGEGFVNFNTLLYNKLQEPCWGNFNFSFFRDLLMLDDFPSYSARRAYVDKIVLFDTTLFYTIIGGIVVDWGKIGAFIFSYIITTLVQNFIKFKGNTILFSQIVMLHFYATICAKGVFYFNYRSDFGGRVILMMILFCLFMKNNKNT